MEFRFYFDYSDYRSYLMMNDLKALKGIPAELLWIPLDAYSLRALSHCTSEEDSPNSRAYAKQEALRYCHRENLDFVWHGEGLYTGSVLRAGIWISQNYPEKFETFSRHVLHQIWGKGQTNQKTVLTSALESIGLDIVQIESGISNKDVFVCQDSLLQEALALGVFDVPALVMDGELVCRFDQAQEIRRIGLYTWLHAQSRDDVVHLCARLLAGLHPEKFRRYLMGMMPQGSVRQESSSMGYIQIQHELPVPSGLYPPAKSPVPGLLLCHPCQEIPDIVAGALNVWVGINGAEALRNQDSMPISSFGVALCQQDGQITIRLFGRDADGGLISAVADGEHALIWGVVSGWHVAVIAPGAKHLVYLVRQATQWGAHIIVCASNGEDFPVESLGVLAHAWAIEVTGRILIGPDGRACQLDSDRALTEGQPLEDGQRWIPPHSRTLLLCDQPLTVGDVHTHADIELGCRGLNLLVASQQQSSELSKTRVFERIRVRGHQMAILPVFETQIFITELIAHRMLEVINQTPPETLPVIVNYWNDLDFGQLDTIRSVLAATLSVLRIPIVWVIGNQVVELWCCGQTGLPYRIEKDDDRFALDLGDIPSTGQCFDQMCSHAGLTRHGYLELLQKIGEMRHL